MRFSIFTGLLFLLLGNTLFAQVPNSGRILTEANLYLSVADWTDIWINGQQLVDLDPNTNVTKGYVKIKLSSDQLCFFQTQNILAFKYTDTLMGDETVTSGVDDRLGIAYALELKFSDGQKLILTSGDSGTHRFYKTINITDADPDGWFDLGFDDNAWISPELFPPNADTVKPLQNPQNGKTVNQMVVLKNVGLQPKLRGFFRRKFPLDIVPGPNCPKSPTLTFTPKPRPTSTWTFTPLPATSTFTPIPTFTFTPIATDTPSPRPTSTPRPLIHLRPTATPTERVQEIYFVPTDTPIPWPTPTPRPRFRLQPTATSTRVRRKRIVPPTDTPIFLTPTETPTPLRRVWKNPTLTPKPFPTATFTLVPLDESAPETIVFVNPPVNVDVSFADGPGRYQLEIQDNNGNSIHTLFDKQVGYEKETWLSWDGTNDQGQLMRQGHYIAVFSKDGKELHRIILDWIAPTP